MHPEDAPQWSYVKQEDFIYDTEIDSRSGFNEDEDYGEETEEVLHRSKINLWSINGQFMVNLWSIYGQFMVNLWSIYGQFIGQFMVK
ncbi:unnamed protein product [Rhizophagus irregularis]|nr:unnamed protein product [Rhizophagus irregularis]